MGRSLRIITGQAKRHNEEIQEAPHIVLVKQDQTSQKHPISRMAVIPGVPWARSHCPVGPLTPSRWARFRCPVGPFPLSRCSVPCWPVGPLSRCPVSRWSVGRCHASSPNFQSAKLWRVSLSVVMDANIEASVVTADAHSIRS